MTMPTDNDAGKKKRTKINKCDADEWNCSQFFKFNHPITQLIEFDKVLYAVVNDSVYKLKVKGEQ